MARGPNGDVADEGDIKEDRNSKAKAREKAGKSPDSESRKKHGKHRRKEELESSESESISEFEEDKEARKRSKEKRKRRRRGSSSDSSSESMSSDLDSEESESGSGTEESKDESEEERRKRKRRRERRRKREREEEREKKRRKREKEKEKKKKKRRKEKEEKKKKRKKEKMERGKKGAVTNSWGKYGIIRETDMWNKRPEFTAWLAEVKQVNLESLPNWEEKQMFKEFMEDHNTATFPSKKYYDLDTYHKRKMEKEIMKGIKKVRPTERTVFNDEEQRRLELLQEREKIKEEQVQALKHSMQSGMAQAMKEQLLLREEMAYQYKLGNFEAAAAIQRRLDPDAAV